MLGKKVGSVAFIIITMVSAIVSNPNYDHYEGIGPHEFFHHPDILSRITFYIKLISSFRFYK